MKTRTDSDKQKDGLVVRAGMAAAAVVAAGTFVVMIVVMMMIAGGRAAGDERSFGKSLRRFISGAGYAGEQPDARHGQRLLSAHANAAADQRFGTASGQETGQSAVSAAVGIDDFGGNDLPVFDFIELKLSGFSKMLEDIAVFVGCSNFHDGSLLFRNGW